MAITNTEDNLRDKQTGIKVGSRVRAIRSGKYSFGLGVVTADEGTDWRIKFDKFDEISVPKEKVIREGFTSTNSVVANALACNRRTASNAFGDSASVGALTTEMVKLLKQIQPIAKRLYNTAFELDDEGTYWLENNKGDKNANKTRIAVERANKVMSRIAEFVTGGI